MFHVPRSTNKGFTLIEILVVIAIISIISAIVLFSITQYINKGKDSNIAGNLAVLVPAGEAFYNIGNTYDDFCDPNISAVVRNAISQMPVNPAGSCSGNDAHMCCSVNINGKSWMACARLFTDTTKAYCVDSMGTEREIDQSQCYSSTTYTSCSHVY